MPRRLLVVAYACIPGRGSEPGAGWHWVRAASGHFPVLLLTRDEPGAELQEAVDREALDIEVQRVRVPSILRLPSSIPGSVHVTYLVWLVLAHLAARRAIRSENFVGGHHLTYAGDWLPSPLFCLPLDIVWGPIGGSNSSPPAVRSRLRWRDRGRESLREAICAPLRRVTVSASRGNVRACVAQNRDLEVLRLLSPAVSVRVRPNVVVEDSVAGRTNSEARPTRAENASLRVAVYAGRLLYWKGLELALTALSRPEVAHWSLRIIGSGPEEERLRARVREMRLEDRVAFVGERERTEVLQEMRAADAFLFPSLHDAAGWAVAEALTVGCPVVCFDWAGPGAIVAETGGGVAVEAISDAPTALAAGLLQSETLRPSGSTAWDESSLDRFVGELYADVFNP